MAGPYSIVTPVQGQPVSSSLFGLAVKNAITDLDARVSALEGTAPGLVAIHTRTSTSATVASATELGVIRMDNIPVRAGYSYEVVMNRVAMTPSVVNLVGFARIRVNQGATATTSSNPIGFLRMAQATSASQTNTGAMIGVFNATADSTLSVLVTIALAFGTGTIQLHSSAAEPSTLHVKLIGPSVNDYGGTADIA
jgi:hypothetical protein